MRLVGRGRKGLDGQRRVPRPHPSLRMVGVEHLCLAVCNTYKYQTGGRPAASRDCENMKQVAEAMYGHSRLRLPYDLVLIGY